jgi:serine/threonine protein kinase
MKASGSSLRYGYTPLYAAPELIYPDEFGRTDERTDIFQLGTIFYELLTGENPFDAETRAGIESAFRVRYPKRPSEINPMISAKCEKIVMKCLEKRKEQRYQNVHQLRIDLADYLEDEYKKSLKVSSDSGDKRKSAFYCANLATLTAKVGNFNETIKYAEDLKNYTEGKRLKIAERMANSFRIILEIGTKWCNKNAKLRDINRKYRELKEMIVEEDLIKEMEDDKDLGMAIRKMNAELRDDERLDEKHVEEVKDFCEKFTEMWIARFLR